MSATISGTGTSSTSGGTYTFDYTTDSALSVGDAVYLDLSNAPILSTTPTSLTVQDATYGTAVSTSNISYSSSSSTLEIDLGGSVTVGTDLSISLPGNPMTAGNYPVSAWNSASGQTVAASGTLTVTSANEVSNLITSASNPVQGEFSSFTVTFTTHTDLPSGGTVTLSLPASISNTPQFPAGDVTVSANNTSVPIGTPSVDNSGNLVVPVQTAISAGTTVTVVAGVHDDFQIFNSGNTGATSVSMPVSVYTSADTATATVQLPLDVSGGTQVQSASVNPFTLGASTPYSVSSPYSVTFTPTSTVTGSVYAVHIAGIPLNYGYTPTITVSQSGTTYTPSYVSVVNQIVTVAVPQSLVADSPVTVTIGSLDGNSAFDPFNPSSGSVGPFTISTDADTAPVQVNALNVETSPQASGYLGNPVAGQQDSVSVSFTAPTSGSTVTIDLTHSGLSWSGSNLPELVLSDGSSPSLLPSGSYSLTNNVLTLQSTALSNVTPGQTVTLQLPMVNGATGSGYITVSSSDTQAAGWFGYDIVPLPTLTATDSSSGASDTLTVSFELGTAATYMQGYPASIQLDVSSLAQAGVTLPAQATLSLGGEAPQTVATNEANGQMTLAVNENLVAGQTDTLSFAITNPTFASADIGVDAAYSASVVIGQANFAGIVEDAAGNPVPDAQLQVAATTTDSLATVPNITTDGSGHFAAQVGAGTYTITGYYVPQDQQYGNLYAPITVTPTQTPATNLVVQAGTPNVAGQITTPSGISDYDIYVYLQNSQGLAETLTTGEGGTLSGVLPPGTWEIYSLSASTATVNLSPTQTLVVPTSGSVTWNYVWPTPNASFTVTQNNSPMQNAWIELAPYANGQPDLSQIQWLGGTDSTGVTTGSLANGTYEVVAVQGPDSSGNYVNYDLTSQTPIIVSVPMTGSQTIQLPTPNLNITLGTGGLPQGESLGYAFVEVAPDNGSGAPDLSQAEWLQANASGALSTTVPSSPSTWYVVAVQTADGVYQANFGSNPVPIIVGSSSTTVAWPATLTITLENAAGSVLPNTQVQIAAPNGDGAWFAMTTDGSGTFPFDEPAGTTWQVMSYGGVDLSEASTPVTFTVPNASTYTLQVPNATVQGQVLDASGQPIPNAWITFAPLTGGSPDWSQATGTQADAQGNYEAVLGAGAWQVLGFWDPATTSWVDLSQDGLTFTVSSSQTSPTVEPVQVPQPNVTGTATGPDGNALANGYVVFIDSTTGNSAVLPTDDSGVFSGELPSGTWSVGYLVSQGGAEVALPNVPISLPTTNLTVNWPTPNVVGQITTASGTPIPGAVLFFAPAGTASHASTWVPTVADSQGDYYVQLSTGDYQIVGLWNDGQFQSMAETVTPPQTGQITLNLQLSSTQLALGSSGANAVLQIEAAGSTSPFYVQADASGSVTLNLPTGSYTIVGYWAQDGSFVQTNQAITLPTSGPVQVSATTITPLQIEVNSVVVPSVDVLLENTVTSQEAWYATSATGQLSGLPDGTYQVLEVAQPDGTTTTPSTTLTFKVSGGTADANTLNVQ
ncbi:MAG: carboxypeptidase-like regulatory domain-containing protein [Thermaerobacter sp.]|nr:carboxypeptidase-like regulatory domain-containing protein [Thermaerobacter sp.]